MEYGFGVAGMNCLLRQDTLGGMPDAGIRQIRPDRTACYSGGY
ncbi:MAG: hypothetical protein ACI4AD_00860 [Roseburia sp.]